MRRVLKRAAPAHPAAGNETPSEQREQVEDKLADAADAYFSDSSRGNDLLGPLQRPRDVSLDDFLERLRR